MKRVFFIGLMGVMAACGCGEKKVPGFNLANLDLTTAPGADFYQYATGGWQAANPLKPEFSRYGSFDVLRENNEIRIRDLFAQMEKSKTEKGSVEQKISDLYKMGMDSVRLNDEKMIPVMESGVMGALFSGSRKHLDRVLLELHRSVGSAAFFAPFVDADLMDSSTNMLYLYQDGLGMGNRDYYLDAENEAIREAYKKYIATLFTLAGYGNADEAVVAVMDIETAIARASLSTVELRDPYKSYNKMTLAQVKKTYPAIDWDFYLSTLRIPKGLTHINVSHPAVLKVANDAFAGDTQKLCYYLAFNVLNAAAGALDDETYNARFEFYGRTMSGQQEPRPRWKRALDVPNKTLSEAVGQMYVAKYFPQSSKDKMLEMVANLQTALGQHISALDWMSDGTKSKALEKLSLFHVKIGYPDKWKEYSTLDIDPSLSYWDNICRANEWHSDDEMSKAGTPVDREKWHMSPQTVNAYYNPTTNEICFPAAILQPPFFNPTADDAINYGAIGVVIGHEMTHGFDDQGRQFDKSGNLNDWWTEADANAFNARADRLVEQFDAVEIQPGLFANGRYTLGENIADQGGLRVAYTAYRSTLNGTSEPAPVDDLTADQRFYLAYATLWAQNVRPEEVARLTKIDSHSLGKNRVNATLRNIDTFFEAFDIKAGEAMYLPENERIIIW